LCSTSGVSGLSLIVTSSSLSPDGASPTGGFALPYPVPEVAAVGLALGAVGTLLVVEVAFPALPSLLPAA